MGEDTRHTKKAAQSKEDRFDEMQMRIAMAASRKHTQPQRNYDPSMILRPEDNEGILEAETALSRELLTNTRWRVNWVDENWQLAKILLFDAESHPKKLRKHATFPSTIVSPNVQPNKIQKVSGDGACMFNCLSFVLFRDVQYNRLVREHVVAHMPLVWDDPRVKLLACLYYQHETKKQCDVRPSLVVLDPAEYIKVSKVDHPKAWAGSTELEVAANWLKTPIKVFNLGNPKYPANSWITYGSQFDKFDARHILLQWSNGNHYDVVLSLT